MKYASILSSLLIILIVALGIYLRHSSSQEHAQWQANEGTVFGTIYHVKYLCEQDLQAEIEAELLQVDSSLSMFNQGSTVSLINRNESDKADEMLSEVLTLSYRIHQATDGAFDPTVAPLVNAWGFGFKSGQLPDSAQVDSLRMLVGLSGIHLDGDKLTKDNPGAILDFSAVAKGYGVDRAAGVLRKHGVEHFMVEIGGEIVAEGLNSKGEPWRIGINKPDDDSTSTNTDLQDIAELSDCAIATSGNYRNFYVQDGRKIAHTINPLTGYPAQQDILSSTVIAPSCAEADGFATAFMVLGLEQAKRVLKEQKQLQAYFIYADEKGQYQTWCSEELEKRIVK